jgi:hypothetical protein
MPKSFWREEGELLLQEDDGGGVWDLFGIGREGGIV